MIEMPKTSYEIYRIMCDKNIDEERWYSEEEIINLIKKHKDKCELRIEYETLSNLEEELKGDD
jgi:hypothetical protein